MLCAASPAISRDFAGRLYQDFHVLIPNCSTTSFVKCCLIKCLYAWLLTMVAYWLGQAYFRLYFSPSVALLFCQYSSRRPHFSGLKVWLNAEPCRPYLLSGTHPTCSASYRQMAAACCVGLHRRALQGGYLDAPPACSVSASVGCLLACSDETNVTSSWVLLPLGCTLVAATTRVLDL
jgi:hypothetical protein